MTAAPRTGMYANPVHEPGSGTAVAPAEGAEGGFEGVHTIPGGQKQGGGKSDSEARGCSKGVLHGAAVVSGIIVIAVIIGVFVGGGGGGDAAADPVATTASAAAATTPGPGAGGAVGDTPKSQFQVVGVVAGATCEVLALPANVAALSSAGSAALAALGVAPFDILSAKSTA